MRIASRLLVVLFLSAATSLAAEPLQQQLLREGPEALARAARHNGDANRGAALFYQPHLA